MAGPLPPPPLNLQPEGLLDFFQIKNGGEYPQTLANYLMPTIEMRAHYEATNSQKSGPTPIAFATATNTLISLIPAVNFWRRCVSLSLAWVPAAAGDQFQGQLLLVNTITNAAELPFPMQPVTLASGVVSYPAAFNFAASAGLQRWQAGFSDFWIPPGLAVMMLEVAGTNAGAAVINLQHRLANYRQ